MPKKARTADWQDGFPVLRPPCILEHDNSIKDDDTVDGIADGNMSREVRWKCRYEDSLIQPSRLVLDVNMGELASGNR